MKPSRRCGQQPAQRLPIIGILLLISSVEGWLTSQNAPTATVARSFNRKALSDRTTIFLSDKESNSLSLGNDEGKDVNEDDGWFDEMDDKVRQMESLTVERKQPTPAVEQERDLFIPIFAVVSLVGLFGSYGYEMMRLASRGELYLPWDQ